MAYHRGHVPDMLRSQGSIHAGWNLWLQGSKRMSSLLTKSSRQMEHPRPSERAWILGPVAERPLAAVTSTVGLVVRTMALDRREGG